jgi:glycosyltransferase involved in cell wall biosynthesis
VASSREAGLKTVLVIPAYNEGEVLGGLVRRVMHELPHLIDEIIVVDDGSTDECAARLPAEPRLQVVRHERNEGKARGLMDGMQRGLERGAHRIVTMDGDGQHRADDIPRLLAASDRYPQALVVGSRLADRDSIPSARYRANRFANFWIAWASGYPVIDSQSGFRVYPAEALREVLPRLARRYPVGPGSRRRGFVFDSEVLIECGRRKFESLAVRVPAIYDTARASHFRPVADIAQIVIMVAGHLLRRGMNLPGLVRSLRQQQRVLSEPAP